MAKNIFSISLPILLFIGAMITFSFFDLDISIALFNANSLFAKIFEAIAEIPFTFIALTSFTILFLTRNRQIKWQSIVISIISIIGILAYSFLMVFFVLNYLKVKGAMIYGFIFFLPISAMSLFFMNFLCKKYGKELKTIAIIAILTILAEQLIINLLKYMWGRPRMRDMVAPYSNFRPWYLPNWFGESDSFPSGHAANSACIIVITLLSKVFGKHKYVGTIITSIVCFVWILTVMISRIIAGAHFASDVITGACITLSIFYFLKARLNGKWRKNNNNTDDSLVLLE